MSFVSTLLYPFFLLFPGAGSHDGAKKEGGDATSYVWVAPGVVGTETQPEALDTLLPDAAPQDAGQVRIEQRMTIRISPRGPAPMPQMFFGMPDAPVQLTERKMGKCLPISGIASVRPDRANRLLLFMRDRSLVSAELDRSCRARDFYSGFYLERSDDGRLCVDRDTLLSRSGMNCKLTRIRQLVEQEH